MFWVRSPSLRGRRPWHGRLTPHSIAHSNTVIRPGKKKKSEVNRRPAEDSASLHPDFEITDMHSSLSSTKTLLHVLARISFYNFPSFKEKAPHSGDSGQSSTFSRSAGSHSSCFHICWLPGTLCSCHGGTSLHKPCQNFLRNFLREKDHMES